MEHLWEDLREKQFPNLVCSSLAQVKATMQQLHLSARAFHQVLKLVGTIADLAESDLIAASHLAEAIQYRSRVGM